MWHFGFTPSKLLKKRALNDPALILGQIHGLRLTPELLVPVSMPWLLFALSVTVFAVIGRVMQFPAGVTGALIITAGLANTSFVGYR